MEDAGVSSSEAACHLSMPYAVSTTSLHLMAVMGDVAGLDAALATASTEAPTNIVVEESKAAPATPAAATPAPTLTESQPVLPSRVVVQAAGDTACTTTLDGNTPLHLAASA